ncbi:phosphatase PAP2 family protein [Microscilla marina]|nr:phosphatase PAP2 family protein [Microscilla marina]
MLHQLIQADIQLFTFLNGFHSPFWDQVMWWISARTPWIPFYVFLVVAMVMRLRWKKGLLAVVSIVLVVIIADRFTSGFMKPHFKRPRPSHEQKLRATTHVVKDANGHEYRGGAYGFASSHSANAFGMAMFMFLLFRGHWRWMFAWAFVVAYSRIYLGVHYPGDILVGGLVGCLAAWFMYQVYKRLAGVMVKE